MEVSSPLRGRRGRSIILVVLMLALGSPFYWAVAAEAQLIRPYALRSSATDQGTIQIVGNTMLTCPAGAADCAAAQAGGAVNNNAFVMTFVDVDGDPATFNSSSADLVLSVGGSVLWAGLYWSGETASGGGAGASAAPQASARNTVKFATPASGGYLGITAKTVDSASASGAYAAFADVTPHVQNGGAGTYQVANVQTGTGPNRGAGWAMVVVLRDPSQPLRDLSVFDGYANVTDSPGANAISTTVTGFKTPAAGSFSVELGAVSLEGDRATNGDRLNLGGTNLGDGPHPANNFFSSAISRLGAHVSARNPSYSNTLGFDIAVVDASGILPNGASSATATFTTTGDQHFPQVLTFAIEVFQPAVSVTKAVVDVNGGSLVPGDELDYTITLANTGNDSAVGVVLTDPIPANTTYVPGSLAVTAGANAGPKSDAAGDDQADFDAASGRVRFRLGTGATATAGGALVPGASTTLRFRVRVNGGVSAGTDISNQATVAFTGATSATGFVVLSDGEPTIGGAQPTTISLANADLVLTKVRTPATVNAGGTITYTLTASNLGPARARDVVIEDATPPNTVLKSVQASADGICLGVPIGGTGTITCTWPALTAVGPASARSVVVVVGVDPDVPAGTIITNSASAGSTTPDSNLANNAASTNTTVTVAADVQVTKTGPGTAVAGTAVTYAIRVTNLGPSDAQGVTLADPTPTGLTFVSATSPCTSGFPCALGTLASGAIVIVNATFQIPSGYTAPDPIVNQASVSATTPDPMTANNTAGWAIVLAAPIVNLSVTKAGPATVVAGEDVTFTLTVTATGPSDAVGPNVVLGDGLTDPLTFQSITPPADWTCSVPEVGSSGAVSCTTPVLPAGGAAVFTLVARLSAGELAGATLGNTATVSSTPGDSDPSDNSGTSSTAVTAAADLQVTKTGPSAALAGTEVTYTIAVTNAGPSDAADVQLADPVPVGLSFVSATGRCGGQSLPCTLGPLAAGTTETVAITFRVPPDFVSSVVINTATAQSVGANATPDPNPANNAASTTTPLALAADLGVTKTGPGSVVAGQQVTYTIQVTNGGPSAAATVVVDDPAPPGLTFVSSSCGTFPCSLGPLAVGSLAIVSAIFAVAPSYTAPDVIVNNATVSSITPDPNAANNTATTSTGETESADIQVAKTGPASAVRGTQVTYTITVTNRGPSNAVGVELDDPTPPDLLFIETSCGSFPCSLGTLAPGASATVTVTYAIPPTYDGPDPIVNRATASAVTPDPALANNNGGWATELAPNQADLVVTKTSNPASVSAGGAVTFGVTLRNLGPSAVAANVALSDALPAGVTFQSITAPPGWSCATPLTGSPGIIACSIPVLPPGDVTFTIVGRVSPSLAAGALIGNSVTVTSTSADPSPANNTGASSSTTQVGADLRVTKTGPPAAVAGTQVTYTIEVANAGPSDAQAVVVDDPAPVGLTLVSASPPCTGGFPCALGSIAAGASKSLTATFAIAATHTTPDPIVNNATATAATPDPVSTNNTGGWATALSPAVANLSVTKTSTPSGAVSPGQLITYTVTVTNTGPSDGAGNVALSDTLQPGVVFVSLSAPPGWNCLTPAPEASGVVSCTNPLIPLGAAVFTIVARATSAAAGPIGNTVTVDSTTEDPAPGDDTASSSVGLSASADLRITKTGPGQVDAGSQIVYQIVVTNAGPSDAQNVVINDPTPSGLTPVSASAPCAGGFPCALGTLAAGASVVIEASFSVSQPFTGQSPLRNVATVASTTPDPDPANNSASQETQVPTATVTAIPTMAEWTLLMLGLILVWFGSRTIRSHSRA